MGWAWLTIPLGPRVDLMRSPIAIAPTKDDYMKQKENNFREA